MWHSRSCSDRRLLACPCLRPVLMALLSLPQQLALMAADEVCTLRAKVCVHMRRPAYVRACA
eukprot:2941076-Alexandrium_andersonii.AAC.1